MFAVSLKKHKATTSEEQKMSSGRRPFYLGTERHESRRIDNQLRGRAGRQGDPGETRFFIALTDDIMRLFGSERIMNMMDTFGIDEDTPIDQKMLSNAIEQAQKRVESRNFQSRKTVLEYDDVMNTRSIIYEQRRRVLDGEDIKNYVQTIITDVIEMAVTSGMAEHNYLTDMDQSRDHNAF
jgi:preprotein translocase subunit SecA